MSEYIIRVKAEHDCWVCDTEGDPGRTRVNKNAKTFDSLSEGTEELFALRSKYPNREFKLERINDYDTFIKPMLAGGLTLEEWIEFETRELRCVFWGVSYVFKPVIAETVLGDGKQLVYFGTMDQRPYYWIMRIDSKTDLESNDFDIETLLEPLEEEFGRVPSPYCMDKKEFKEFKGEMFPYEFESYDEYVDACQYPSVNYEGGHYGLIVNMVTGEVG